MKLYTKQTGFIPKKKRTDCRGHTMTIAVILSDLDTGVSHCSIRVVNARSLRTFRLSECGDVNSDPFFDR
jgi:hypothetical protein